MKNSVDLFWALHLGRHHSKLEGRHLISEGGMMPRGAISIGRGLRTPPPGSAPVLYDLRSLLKQDAIEAMLLLRTNMI